MGWDRIERQQAILREKIAVIVLDRLNDPRLGFVTVTRTHLSRDRRRCQVFYTVLGNDTQKRTTARALDTAAPRVQELLAPVLSTRLVPEIVFVYDESVERESHLLGLIDQLEIAPETSVGEDSGEDLGKEPDEGPHEDAGGDPQA